MNQNPLLFGLDLGQLQDFAALTIVEMIPGPTLKENSFAVVHAHRWPLGTSYSKIAADVKALTQRPYSPHLATAPVCFDFGGVGGGVEPILIGEGLNLIAFTATSGDRVTEDETAEGLPWWKVPKTDLFSNLQLLLDQNRLHVAPGIPFRDDLMLELQSFTMKYTSTGRPKFDIERSEGTGHGDLVSSLVLALFHGLRNPRLCHPRPKQAKSLRRPKRGPLKSMRYGTEDERRTSNGMPTDRPSPPGSIWKRGRR